MQNRLFTDMLLAGDQHRFDSLMKRVTESTEEDVQRLLVTARCKYPHWLVGVHGQEQEQHVVPGPEMTRNVSLLPLAARELG